MKKKVGLVLLITASIGGLAACSSETPDEKLTEEQMAEFQVEKEMNKISGVKDEAYAFGKEIEENELKKGVFIEKYLNEEIKLTETSSISKDNVRYGFEAEWIEMSERIIYEEIMLDKFKEKEIEDMKEKLKKTIYNEKDIADVELTFLVLRMLEAANKEPIKNENVMEYYEKNYMEKIHKGLIDEPLYEGNEEYYEVMYLREIATKEAIEINKKELDKIEFKEGYKWIDSGIRAAKTLDNVNMDRNDDDEVIFEIKGKKVTVGQLVERVYLENYLIVYGEIVKSEKMKKMLGEQEVDVQKINGSLAKIGVEMTEAQVVTMMATVKALEETGYFENNDFEKYMSEKVTQVGYPLEISEDENVRMFYKEEFYYMNSTTSEELEKVEKKIADVEIEMDEKYKELEEIYNNTNKLRNKITN